jgi:hypothetical protein
MMVALRLLEEGKVKCCDEKKDLRFLPTLKCLRGMIRRIGTVQERHGL